MKRTLAWSLAGILVLAATGAFGVQVYYQREAERQLDMALARLPEGSESSHGPVRYSLLHDRLTVEQLAIRKAGQVDAVSIGRVELEGAHWRDADKVSRSLALARDARTKGPVTLFSSLRAIDVRASRQGGGDLAVSSILVQDYAVDPAKLPEGADPATLWSAAYLPETLAAISIGHSEFEGASVAMPDGSASVARLVIDGQDGTSLRHALVTDLSSQITGNVRGANDFALARIELDNFRFDPASMLAMPARTPSWKIDRLALAGLSLKSPAGPSIRLDKANLVNSDRIGDLSTAAAIKAEGLSVTVSEMPDEMARAALQQMGYAAVTVDIDLASRWDVSTKILTVETFDVTGRDMGRLRLSAALGNVDLQALAAAGTNGLPLLAGANLVRFGMRYEDASLTDKLMALMAEGRSPEIVRAETIARVDAFKLAFSGSPVLMAALDAVTAFLRAPKSLEVKVEPSAPLPFLALAAQGQSDPLKLASDLNLQVTANK